MDKGQLRCPRWVELTELSGGSWSALAVIRAPGHLACSKASLFPGPLEGTVLPPRSCHLVQTITVKRVNLLWGFPSANSCLYCSLVSVQEHQVWRRQGTDL